LRLSLQHSALQIGKGADMKPGPKGTHKPRKMRPSWKRDKQHATRNDYIFGRRNHTVFDFPSQSKAERRTMRVGF
jgi:hypothetical protein